MPPLYSFTLMLNVISLFPHNFIQVVFDENDKMKTRKPTTAMPLNKLPTQVVKGAAAAPPNKNDLR